MPSSAVNICVLTLVLLSIQHTCHGRPQSHSKREIVKDYFNPLILNPEEFEMGEDGKFYLKKSAHKLDSAVNYINPEKIEETDTILKEDFKATDVEMTKDKTEAVQVEELKNELQKQMETEKEVSVIVEVSSTPPIVKEEKIVEELILPKSETSQEEKFDFEKAPFTPVDPKMVVSSKPNSKDEVSIKTDVTPVVEEEKVNQKVAIGQVPHLNSKVIPFPNTFRIPILIPIRQISYRTMSVLPLPSADSSDRLPLPHDAISDRMPFQPAEASDRLPLSFEDDIIGEGEHESASLGEISEPAADNKKDAGYPLAIGVRLPFLSFSGLLEELKGIDQQDAEKQTKIVDVLGKKFLMQSNVMKYPSGDNSRTFIRFMSVKPLESVDPEKAKEAVAEEAIKKVIEAVRHQEVGEPDTKKEFEIKKDEIMKPEVKIDDEERQQDGVKPEILKSEEKITEEENQKEVELMKSEILESEDKIVAEESQKEVELLKPEILKVDESQINVQVDPQVPKEIAKNGDSVPEMNLSNPEQTGLKEAVKKIISEAKINIGKNSLVEVLNPFDGSEKKAIEPLDEELEIKSSEESESEEDEEIEEDKIFTPESAKKMEIDALIKEGTDMAVKEEFFVVENKKKGMSSEEIKPKKKIEKKKKKKCKCEEVDSDSEEDYEYQQ